MVMAKPRKTSQARTRARLQRERERTPAFAVSLSIATIFLVALIAVIVMCNTYGTALYNLFQGLMAQTLSPRSVLYGQIISQVEFQEAVIFTPISLLCGGIALGRLISTRFTRIRLLGIAATASAGVLMACLLFRWTLLLVAQHGHLFAGEITSRLVLTQIGCTVGWIAAYLLGTWLGVLWRDQGRPKIANSPAAAGIPAA